MKEIAELKENLIKAIRQYNDADNGLHNAGREILLHEAELAYKLALRAMYSKCLPQNPSPGLLKKLSDLIDFDVKVANDIANGGAIWSITFECNINATSNFIWMCNIEISREKSAALTKKRSGKFLSRPSNNIVNALASATVKSVKHIREFEKAVASISKLNKTNVKQQDKMEEKLRLIAEKYPINRYLPNGKLATGEPKWFNNHILVPYESVSKEYLCVYTNESDEELKTRMIEEVGKAYPNGSYIGKMKVGNEIDITHENEIDINGEFFANEGTFFTVTYNAIGDWKLEPYIQVDELDQYISDVNEKFPIGNYIIDYIRTDLITSPTWVHRGCIWIGINNHASRPVFSAKDGWLLTESTPPLEATTPRYTADFTWGGTKTPLELAIERFPVGNVVDGKVITGLPVSTLPYDDIFVATSDGKIRVYDASGDQWLAPNSHSMLYECILRLRKTGDFWMKLKAFDERLYWRAVATMADGYDESGEYCVDNQENIGQVPSWYCCELGSIRFSDKKSANAFIKDFKSVIEYL